MAESPASHKTTLSTTRSLARSRTSALLKTDVRKATDDPAVHGLRLLIYGCFAIGVLLTVGAIGFLQLDDVPVLALVLAFVVIAERLDVAAYDQASVSVSVAGIVAALILVGPEGAVLLSAAAALIGDLGRSRPSHAMLFNLGTWAIASAIAGGVYAAAAIPLQGHEGPGLVAPALAASVTIFVVESSLVALAIATKERRPLLAVWRQKLQWALPHYLLLGGLGAAVAIAYNELGPLGALAFLAPPLMLRFSMKQYVDKTARTINELEQSNRELSSANRSISKMTEELATSYQETLEALIGALDARDSETHGHSSRVQMLTLELAREAAIEEGSDQWKMIRHGSILHDVGKIAVPDAILRKPGALTDEEKTLMHRHALAGANILEQVSFLRPAAALVHSHHERWDGTGYPRGLKAEEIPLGARIFMIADTYDAITSNRVYRKARSPEAARDEIVRCSGSQFDPAAVEAFLRLFPRWAARTRREKKKQGQAA